MSPGAPPSLQAGKNQTIYRFFPWFLLSSQHQKGFRSRESKAKPWIRHTGLKTGRNVAPSTQHLGNQATFDLSGDMKSIRGRRAAAACRQCFRSSCRRRSVNKLSDCRLWSSSRLQHVFISVVGGNQRNEKILPFRRHPNRMQQRSCCICTS